MSPATSHCYKNKTSDKVTLASPCHVKSPRGSDVVPSLLESCLSSQHYQASAPNTPRPSPTNPVCVKRHCQAQPRTHKTEAQPRHQRKGKEKAKPGNTSTNTPSPTAPPSRSWMHKPNCNCKTKGTYPTHKRAKQAILRTQTSPASRASHSHKHLLLPPTPPSSSDSSKRCNKVP
jgi:hypothetical protein